MQPTAAAPARPSISDYTLLEFLGEGATAQVYLAEHDASNARVAIKVIDKLLVQRSQLEGKVQQEMVLHAELQHPHVLRVERVFEDARNYYMVLEHCAHRSLSAIVKTLPGRRLDESRAKTLFRQVVSGVAYLHASGVIHRDLKLANLLVHGDGGVRISDFGLAARLGEDHVTMCGTPNFIAPEVLTAPDEPYDAAVDIWSLGCILYCLLLGRAPFEGRRVSETLENVANAAQHPLQFPDGFSSSASDLIKRLLSPVPHCRPSAQQILTHTWLRGETRKRAPPQSCARRKSSVWIPPHPRALSRRYTESLRESGKGAALRSGTEANRPLPSVRLTGPSKTRSRRSSGDPKAGSQERRQLEAFPIRTGTSNVQSMPFVLGTTSGDSSVSLDYSSRSDGCSDFSALPLSASTISSDDERIEGRNKVLNGQTDEAVSETTEGFTSVVVHVELQDVEWLGILQARNQTLRSAKVALQWSCNESAEVGRPPTFRLDVSNGWKASYDPATGTLVATTAEGESMRYDIPGVRSSRADSVAVCGPSPSRFAQRTLFPPLVRLCQCLALRTMQLRRIALRSAVSKLPFVHYDTLPASLLTSFRSRSSLLQRGFGDKFRLHEATTVSSEDWTETQRAVDIAGLGRGYIDASGDLTVVYVDGAQLTLAASGQRLWFVPSWGLKHSHGEIGARGDVFELLTAGSRSSFLPSAVKQKLESVPEFIRRLKGGSQTS
ncbi:unnamed protein product [Hyaloperonospora brassicae]|uniref:Protein kinase domain-containing protein n=1 Tax=Hyaloperonospora brassicae TaxID=162125 RepID=A0AAV0V0W1_HYABA|nr:unnamed protein product [Hyaloperonospora brassicae]